MKKLKLLKIISKNGKIFLKTDRDKSLNSKMYKKITWKKCCNLNILLWNDGLYIPFFIDAISDLG